MEYLDISMLLLHVCDQDFTKQNVHFIQNNFWQIMEKFLKILQRNNPDEHFKVLVPDWVIHSMEN